MRDGPRGTSTDYTSYRTTESCIYIIICSFSLKEPGDSGFTPLPADELPAGSVVVFVSHRWLGNGCPDDDKGTKLQQVGPFAGRNDPASVMLHG